MGGLVGFCLEKRFFGAPRAQAAGRLRSPFGLGGVWFFFGFLFFFNFFIFFFTPPGGFAFHRYPGKGILVSRPYENPAFFKMSRLIFRV